MTEHSSKTHVGMRTIQLCVEHPKTLTALMIVVAVVFAAMMPWVQIDTDPENMLAEEEPVRVFHNAMKEEFTLYDMVVVGVVDEEHPDGVFHPETLNNIYELTHYSKTLRWPDPDEEGKTVGVVETDILAPSMVDNIEQGGLGTVRFEWLMEAPPETREAALQVRDEALDNPLLKGTLVSEDGKAIALYFPITDKDLSYRVSTALQEKIDEFSGSEEYHITGLPVAEDTFGVEMFIQMAVSAPLAMLVIFLLMLYFFRKWVLIISPMIVAVVSVICAMGLLIGTGNKVHIMSSMIPIFIMPIAVLDSIHILSDFFDRYQYIKDRKKTILYVMRHLFVPMLYTSLTSAAGFASLALAPIPPVQVFGIFVAFGIMMAWLLSITFIPAYTMFIREESLESFGAVSHHTETPTGLAAFMQAAGRVTYHRFKLILGGSVLVIAISVYGISQIQINDNPIKWFTKNHPIRVADRVFNEHFGGTYMAYLTLEPTEQDPQTQKQTMLTRLQNELTSIKQSMGEDFPNLPSQVDEVIAWIDDSGAEFSAADDMFLSLKQHIQNKMDDASFEALDAWDEILAVVERVELSQQTFKRPEVLRYLTTLENEITQNPNIGKVNTVADIVKKVHKELFEGKEEYNRIPDTAPAVAQCLISYQNSHNPDDLWHLVTPDYQKATLWFQLKSGDNQDMEQVVREVNAYFESHPAPVNLQHDWFGLTYINVVWQNKMVAGMLYAFLGSFLIVFLMMTLLFSSPLWGLLCMIPLTITIGFIYGIIGWVGKDYDMPVAVLSSLTLGLAVDFAIHFLARSRELTAQYGTWDQSIHAVFAEPARAISRNVIVIAVGFLPLLAAPLMPYKTVGIFIAAILAVSGIGTLLILPALVTWLKQYLFKPVTAKGTTCNCAVCIVSSILVVLLIALNIRDFFHVEWNVLTWMSIILIPLLAILCAYLSRRKVCQVEDIQSQEKE